jgi:hypothetical protein
MLTSVDMVTQTETVVVDNVPVTKAAVTKSMPAAERATEGKATANINPKD